MSLRLLKVFRPNVAVGYCTQAELENYLSGNEQTFVTARNIDIAFTDDTQVEGSDRKYGRGYARVGDIKTFLETGTTNVVTGSTIPVGAGFVFDLVNTGTDITADTLPVDDLVTADPADGPLSGYGLLYNVFAVFNAGGLLPAPFSIPTSGDFTTLQTFLGGSSPTALATKTTNVLPTRPGWPSGQEGDNSSGLGVVPSGIRDNTGAYDDFEDEGYLWTSTFSGSLLLFYWSNTNNTSITGSISNNFGAPIRGVSTTEPSEPIVTDVDGNQYSWIQIGSQYWMQQNLKTTRYNNGVALLGDPDDSTWSTTTDGAWSYPNADNTLIL